MEDGVKRKLPSWMSKVGVIADTVGQSEAKKGVHNANNLKDDNTSRLIHVKSKTKEKPVKKDGTQAHETLDYDAKKRKGKKLNLGSEGASSVIEVCETVVEKRKGTSGKRKIKNKRKEMNIEKSEEIESPCPNEDGGELTVEDLLTIAQEYVRGDENSRQQQLSDEFHDGNALSVHDSGGLPFVPPRNKKEPLIPKERIPVHSSMARTEDPAQDMLDLFLGPLLRKPISEDKMIKNVEEDRVFVREVKEKVHDGNIALADFVPLTKKKSSLKDKVAMCFE